MTSVDSEELIKEDPGCKELLLEAMRYHLLPEQRASLASDRTQERKPDGMRPYIFAIGVNPLGCIACFFTIRLLTLMSSMNH
jgi:kelch-like protein 17 (actinfilin)